MNEELEENVAIVQCKGKNTNGRPCQNKIGPKINAEDQGYCKLHAYQRKGAPPLRHCDGMTAENKPCTRPMPNGARNEAVFCALHRDQSDHIKFVRCFGKFPNGKACSKGVRWAHPYLPFCTEHLSQAETFGCAITSLPNDISSIILEYLEPVERVNFAWVNKSCATLVRSWAANRPTPEHMQKKKGLATFFLNRPVLYPNRTLPPSRQGTEIIETEHHCGRDYLIELFGFPTVADPAWGTRALTLAIRTCPELFRAGLGFCMRCAVQLGPEDSKEWSQRFKAPVTGKQSKWIVKNGLEGAVTTENNKETMLCKNCIGCSMGVQWCVACHGEITPTARARAYWKTQDPLDDDTEMGETQDYDDKDDESNAQDEPPCKRLRHT